MTRRLEHAPDVWEDFLCSTCRTFNVSYGNILLFKLQCLVHERQGAVTSNWVIGPGTFLLSARIFFSLSNPVANKPFYLSYINNLLKLQTFLARTPGNSCTKLSKMKEMLHHLIEWETFSISYPPFLNFSNGTSFILLCFLTTASPILLPTVYERLLHFLAFNYLCCYFLLLCIFRRPHTRIKRGDWK